MHSHSHHPIERSQIRGRALTKVTFIGLLANILLTAGQAAAGILGHSIAMVSASIHSLSDLASNAIVLLLLSFSAKGKSPRFAYGRGKFESFASLLIGLALFWVAIDLMKDGIESIRSILGGEEVERPSVLVLWVAGISIVIKLMVYVYTATMGHKYDSPTLIAKSWHDLTDALTPIGVMVATGLAIALGDKWVLLDPIVACIISLVVLVPATKVLIIACKDLLDVSLCPEEEAQIVQTLESLPMSAEAAPNARTTEGGNAATAENGLATHNLNGTAPTAGLKVLQLKTRRSGPVIFIEATLAAPTDLTLPQADALRAAADTALRQHFGPDTCLTLTFRARRQS
ncbi:MAG: cation transporter [Bacteroidales bacterium]|nr:cation transporter [Bacteroidales bacterium]